MAIRQTSTLINNGLVFPEHQVSQNLLKEYKINGNPLKSFLSERFDNVDDAEARIGTSSLYDEFSDYCRENLLPVFKSHEFRTNIAQFGYSIRKGRYKQLPNPVSCVLGLKRKK